MQFPLGIANTRIGHFAANLLAEQTLEGVRRVDPAVGVEHIFGNVFGVNTINGIADILTRCNDQREGHQNHNGDRVVQTKYRRIGFDVIHLDQVLETPKNIQHFRAGPVTLASLARTVQSSLSGAIQWRSTVSVVFVAHSFSFWSFFRMFLRPNGHHWSYHNRTFVTFSSTSFRRVHSKLPHNVHLTTFHTTPFRSNSTHIRQTAHPRTIHRLPHFLPRWIDSVMISRCELRIQLFSVIRTRNENIYIDAHGTRTGNGRRTESKAFCFLKKYGNLMNAIDLFGSIAFWACGDHPTRSFAAPFQNCN